ELSPRGSGERGPGPRGSWAGGGPCGGGCGPRRGAPANAPGAPRAASWRTAGGTGRRWAAGPGAPGPAGPARPGPTGPGPLVPAGPPGPIGGAMRRPPGGEGDPVTGGGNSEGGSDRDSERGACAGTSRASGVPGALRRPGGPDGPACAPDTREASHLGLCSVRDQPLGIGCGARSARSTAPRTTAMRGGDQTHPFGRPIWSLAVDMSAALATDGESTSSSLSRSLGSMIANRRTAG
ncbi:MAG: hypothetical protein QOH45_3700, partial [Pseudonocardiales bacterium]|nr:hypothetical protein [Pseudonocardiales bacterium]